MIELRDASGLVPVAASPKNVQVTIKSVSPTVSVNQNGGDLITITGSGFPNEASLVTVEFEDGTFCRAISSTPVKIVCKIEGFNKSNLNTSKAMKFRIVFVPQSSSRRRNLARTFFAPTNFASSPDLFVGTANPRVVSVTPKTLSPVLTNRLTFTLAEYTQQMVLGDFTVEMVSTSDPSAASKRLTVISVDDASKTILVSFLGGALDIYTFKVSGAGGFLDCPSDQIFIETIFEVTDI